MSAATFIHRNVSSVFDFNYEMVCLRTDEFFKDNKPTCNNRCDCVDVKHRRTWLDAWSECLDTQKKQKNACPGAYRGLPERTKSYMLDQGPYPMAPVIFRNGMHVHNNRSLYVAIINTTKNQIQFVAESCRMVRNMPARKFTLLGNVSENSPEGVALRIAQQNLASTIQHSVADSPFFNCYDVISLVAEYIVENEMLETIVHFIHWKSIQAQAQLSFSDLSTGGQSRDPAMWERLVDCAKLQTQRKAQGKNDPLEPQVELIEESIGEHVGNLP